MRGTVLQPFQVGFVLAWGSFPDMHMLISAQQVAWGMPLQTSGILWAALSSLIPCSVTSATLVIPNTSGSLLGSAWISLPATQLKLSPSSSWGTTGLILFLSLRDPCPLLRGSGVLKRVASHSCLFFFVLVVSGGEGESSPHLSMSGRPFYLQTCLGSAFYVLPHFVLRTVQLGRCSSYPHF